MDSKHCKTVATAVIPLDGNDWRIAIDPANSGRKEKWYAAGVVIGRYARGSGQYILNALAVLDHVDRHPAADRLLLNLIRYAQRLRQGRNPLKSSGTKGVK